MSQERVEEIIIKGGKRRVRSIHSMTEVYHHSDDGMFRNLYVNL